MMSKYLILGGGGSFSINLSHYLLDKEETKEVVGVGRNFLRASFFSLDIEKRRNYKYYPLHITYELDLLLELIDQIKPDYIINFAAQGEGAVSWKNSWRFFETNSMALSRLTEALASKKYLKKFIQVGSSEVYGSVDRPVREDDPVFPSSPYAASKVAFDFYLISIFKHLGFPASIVRPSNAYCPGQLLHRVIPKSIILGLQNKKLPLHGGGRAEKTYIHASDLSEAIYLMIHKGDPGKIYNVGADKPTAIKDVVALCAKSIGKSIYDIADIAPDRLGQDSKYWLDSSLIKNDLGWEQKIDLESGINDVANWVIKNKEELFKISTDYFFRG